MHLTITLPPGSSKNTQARGLTFPGSHFGLGARGRLGEQGLQSRELLFGEDPRGDPRPDVVRLPGQLVPEEGPQLHSRLTRQGRRRRRLHAPHMHPCNCVLDLAFVHQARFAT